MLNLKPYIVHFFTFILLGYLVFPSVTFLIDDTTEIAIYLDFNEEEENKEEAQKDYEIEINYPQDNHVFSDNLSYKKDKSTFSIHKYTSKYSEVNTPPPKVFL